MGGEKRIARRIHRSPRFRKVRISIHFNDDLFVMTVEIDDVGTDAVLPTEF